MFKKNIICLSFLLLHSFNVIGQKIAIEVDKLEYNIKDRIEITYKVRTDTDSIGEIDQSQFEFVEGPSQKIGQGLFNGKSSFIKTYSYFITPLKPGKIKLPQLPIYLNGKNLKAEDVYIDIKGTLLTEAPISNKISSYKEHKAGHRFEIVIPSYMDRTVGMLDRSAVEYRNIGNDLYGYVPLKLKKTLNYPNKTMLQFLNYMRL